MSQFSKKMNELLREGPRDFVGRTMYFDESNNIRKGTIIEGKVNNPGLENLYFVLGGISAKENIDFKKLLDYVGAKQHSSDVKYKFFSCGKSAFEDSIKQKRLFDFFEYLFLNNVFIHFGILHYFFSVVDILDSLIDEKDEYQEKVFNDYQQMQSDMTEVLFFNFDKLLSILYKFSFPNIPVDKTSDFLNDILNLYETNLDIINSQNKYNDENKEFLFHLINSKKNKKNLIFLNNNKNYIISDGVDYFYLSRILNFSLDSKMFDIESTVMEKLKFNESDTKKYKFKFCDSKSVIEIQLSDVIVDFVGRLFNFISHNDRISLSKWISQKCKQKDNDYSLKTLYYFFKLMDISDNKTPLMFKKVIPLYLIKRFDFFMKEILKISQDKLIK